MHPHHHQQHHHHPIIICAQWESPQHRTAVHATHFALDCATQVRTLEHQIPEVEHMVHNRPLFHWLKVPHNPYGGDPLSFHLPLHRAVLQMAMHYGTLQLCRSFRDLDMLLV